MIYILYAALNFSLFPFLYIAYADMLTRPQQPNSILPFPFQLIGILPALVSIFMHYKMRSPQKLALQIQDNTPWASAHFNHEILKEMPDKEAKLVTVFPRFMASFTASLALNESIVIFGIIAITLDGISYSQFLISFFTGLTLNLLMFPNLEKLFNEIKLKIN